ncbi:hypothetical protein ACFVZD_41370 [Streptomyces sp. NPDC058287]|uniref:hypothetical protein n=1 Tax=Streptomyces sp. NPDC058287 TaxID=3346423 RepID=UPI0036E3ED43
MTSTAAPAPTGKQKRIERCDAFVGYVLALCRDKKAQADLAAAARAARVPLALPKASKYTPPSDATDIPVAFLWERYPHPQLPDDAVTLTANDVPLSFAQHGRSHGKRSLYRTTEPLAASLRGDQVTLHQRLIDYAKKDT